MSGGVDSSVAAGLLVEQGYDVVGLFMRTGVEEAAADGAEQGQSCGEVSADASSQSDDSRRLPTSRDCIAPAAQESRGAGTSGASRHQGCCSASDAADARFVAGLFDIPFYALNFEQDFNRLINYFADEYARGRTPNPCIVCNDQMKFGKLVEYADAVGAKYIATGHYARIGRRNERPALLRGVDGQKDQSYVLFGLDRGLLDRLMFPVGELTKSEVRETAERLGLPNRDKPDSVEICFVPDNDYARVVKERRPDAFVEGDVVDSAGRVIGRHKGVANYTVGQRRGLGIAAGEPIYVTRLDPKSNTVTMGDGDALLERALLADRANFLVDVPDESFRADVKIRYLHRAAPATVTRLDDGGVRILFDEPQRAITPGQAVVFYDGDVLLGGAWIVRAETVRPR